jgi:hypothetical protein
MRIISLYTIKSMILIASFAGSAGLFAHQCTVKNATERTLKISVYSKTTSYFGLCSPQSFNLLPGEIQSCYTGGCCPFQVSALFRLDAGPVITTLDLPQQDEETCRDYECTVILDEEEFQKQIKEHPEYLKNYLNTSSRFFIKEGIHVICGRKKRRL